MLLHVIFYFTDSLPLLQTLFSLTCHIVYLQNFSNTWPLISLTSLSFLASCALVIADHFIWFFYFARITNEARQSRLQYRGHTKTVPGFTEIASFFAICVWYTPLFLFLSLSANDNALPVIAGESLSSFIFRLYSKSHSSTEPTSPNSTNSIQTGPSRTSLIRSMFSFISFEGSIPRLRPRPSRKDTSEGLIAPRSPNLSRTPLSQGHGPSSPMIRPAAYPPPPRSPGPRVQELEISSIPASTNPNFSLDSPPRRRQQVMRQATSEYLDPGASGMRRTTSFKSDDN